MATWGYQRHPNHRAPNGEFFGRKGRDRDVDMVVIHTAEIEPVYTVPDTTAERLSKYMGNTEGRSVSWHASVDADSISHELPGGWTAAHVRGWNSRTIGVEIGTRHDLWDQMPTDHSRQLIENTARVTAWFCKNHHIPAVRIESLDQARAGQSGIVAHSTLDPSRRSDPGPGFPWDEFVRRVGELIRAEVIAGIGDRGTMVSDIQSRLIELGYGDLVGPIDGVAGAMFDTAVRAYEADRGASATGLWIPPCDAQDPGPGGCTDDRRPFVTISASVGAGGVNRRQDVEAVAARLDELGFMRPDRGLEHCIRLFQAAKNGGESLRQVDGRVDPGHDTLAWLNARNAPRWQQMPEGSEHDGFRSRERLQRHDDHGWATDWLADTLRGAAVHYKADYLDRTPDAPLIWSNDASPLRGGDTPDHGGHEAGMQLDIVLPPQGASSRGLTVASAGYDRNAARAMIQAFRKQGGIDVIYLNDDALIAEGMCQRAAGHHDHLHVHIRPPSRIEGENPPPAGLSIDWGFIGLLEGEGVRTGYVPRAQDGVTPAGQSGVTIATGFDLGQHAAGDLVGLGIPSAIVDRLRPYCGLKGSDAVDYLDAHPLSLSRAEVDEIDRRVKPDKARGVERHYDEVATKPLASLPPAAQTVIVSVLFQYGHHTRVPRFWRFSVAHDWPGVIAELRDFGDDYPTRRHREADYLARWLGLETGAIGIGATADEPQQLTESNGQTPPSAVTADDALYVARLYRLEEVAGQLGPIVLARDELATQ